MVSTLEWVLVGVVAYAVVVMVLRARGILPDYVKGSGPIVTLHTQRGKAVLGWLARPKRAWRAWGNLGVGIALVIMVAALAMILTSGYTSLTNPPQPSALSEPRNILVIPGVNDFLPLSVAPELIAGLAIALIVHEGGHGLFCRVGDIDIESMGLAFLSFVPMGAFVAPDEESVTEANRGAQTRMFAAGVTNNFAIGLVAVLLLFGPVVASISVVGGAPVGDTLPDGPAAEAGIDSGDVVTSVAGQPVENVSAFEDALAAAEPSIPVELRDGRTTTIEQRVFVTGAPPDGSLDVRDTITAVNGTTVRTETQFDSAVENRTVAVLSRANGSAVTTAIGATVQARENGSLAAAGAPSGDSVVVTQAGGERIRNAGDLQAVLEAASPGEELRIVAHVEGEPREYTVELAEGATTEDARLGITLYSGTSGIIVTDLGMQYYPAEGFLNALGADGFDSIPAFLIGVGLLIALPFAGIVGLAGYNFPGFNGLATNFYVVDGPLAVLGTGGAFLLANLLFWTAWINVNVAFFNLFPMYPLDGGHILRTVTESVVARLPIEDGRRVTTAFTVGVTVVMLASMAMLFIGPQLLA